MMKMRRPSNRAFLLQGTILVLVTVLAAPVFALQKMEAAPPDREASRITIVPSDGFAVRIWTDGETYHLGDPVRICFRATRNAYVYIFDTEPNGVTHQIFPNFYDQDNSVRGGITYSIPDVSYELRVTGPAGWETLRIVAVRERHRFLEDYNRGFNRSKPFPERPSGASALIEKLEQFSDDDQKQSDRAYPKRPTGITVYPYPYHYPFYAESITGFEVLGDYWEAPSEQAVWGVITVSSKPSGARIFVDDHFEGTTPKAISIPPGSHDVMLVMRGYEVWRTSVHLSPGGYQRVTARLVPRRWTPFPPFRHNED
jgi:hypothetical protein